MIAKTGGPITQVSVYIGRHGKYQYYVSMPLETANETEGEILEAAQQIWAQNQKLA